MPALTTVWMILPTTLGLMVVPSANAQRQLIDLVAHGIKHETGTQLLMGALPTLLLIVGVTLATVVVSSFRRVVDYLLKEKATLYMQSAILDRSLGNRLERFENPEFYDRLQRAQSVVGKEMIDLLGNAAKSVELSVSLIGALVVVGRGHWLIPVVTGAFACAALVLRLRTEIAVRKLNRNMTSEGRMADYIKDTTTDPSIIKEIKVFDADRHLMETWSRLSRNAHSRRANARRNEIRLGALLSSVQAIVVFLALYLMFGRLRSGAVTPGIVAISIQLIVQVQVFVMRLTFPLSRIYLQCAQVYDLEEFLSMEVPQVQTGDAEPGSDGRLQLDHVSFQYPGGGAPAVEDVSITIEPGETVAVVGDNGAGKSTLVRLLLGLYLPTSGRLTWDGVDLSALNPRTLSQRTSAVFQDFVRYELTVRDNVGFGQLLGMGHDKRLHAVLEECNLMDVVQEAGGLDARVGRILPNGRELSGGQWQRLAIARALYRDARVVVLDEPTAAIDPSAEVELFQRFRELARGRTAVFVSHRLGWARYADRILVLSKGRLVEVGTHEELMKLNGTYADGFRTQASWYLEPAGLEATGQP